MRANVGITPGICALAILILIPLSLRAENVKEYYQDKAGGVRQVELTEIKLGDLPKPSYELSDDQSYGNYRVCTFHNSEEGKGYFEILRNGKRVYKRKGFKFRIGLIYDDEGFRELKDLGDNISNVPIAMGKDITGRGIPNLVVSEWTGGATVVSTSMFLKSAADSGKLRCLMRVTVMWLILKTFKETED